MFYMFNKTRKFETFIEKTYLYQSQRFQYFATKLCFDIVNISKLKKRIDDSRIFRIINIDFSHQIKNAQ